MPIPALAGLPWLASVVGTIVGSVAVFLGKFFTRHVAIKVGFSVAFLALFASFALYLGVLVDAVVIALPSEYGVVLSYIIPWNLAPCIALIISAEVGLWVYRFKVVILKSIYPGQSL